MTYRIPLWIATTATVLILGLLAVPGMSEPDRDGRGFMRGKLVHSQQVLESLALEDFGGMAQHAEQMKLLSLDANWQVLRTEAYARHSADFRRSTASLIAAADDKNLDGAVLAYFQLTQNCVNCHRYVRQIQHSSDQ